MLLLYYMQARTRQQSTSYKNYVKEGTGAKPRITVEERRQEYRL